MLLMNFHVSEILQMLFDWNIFKSWFISKGGPSKMSEWIMSPLNLAPAHRWWIWRHQTKTPQKIYSKVYQSVAVVVAMRYTIEIIWHIPYRLKGGKNSRRFMNCWHVINVHEPFICRCNVHAVTHEKYWDIRKSQQNKINRKIYFCVAFLTAFAFILPYKVFWLQTLVA